MKQIAFSSSFLFILCISSCTHYYYVPNQPNVPVFKEKNEFRLSAAYINASEVNGADMSAAYAFTKEAAVIANALLINPRSGPSGTSPAYNPNYGGDGKGYLGEIGTGFFKAIPSKIAPISKKFVFETYGVLGIGKAVDYYQNYPGYNVSTLLFKPYIQPSVSFTTNLFDVILSAKIGGLFPFGVKNTFPDTAYESSVQGGSTLDRDLGILNSNKASFLFEPAFTFRIGYKYIKFYYSIGGCYLSTAMRQLTVTPVMDFGLSIALARRFWQKDNREKKDRWKRIWD